MDGQNQEDDKHFFNFFFQQTNISIVWIFLTTAHNYKGPKYRKRKSPCRIVPRSRKVHAELAQNTVVSESRMG